MLLSMYASDCGKIGVLRTRQVVRFRSTVSTSLSFLMCLRRTSGQPCGRQCGETPMVSCSNRPSCELFSSASIVSVSSAARLTRVREPAMNWWSSQGPSRPNQPSNSQSFSSALQSVLQTIAEEPKDKSDSLNRKQATYDPGDNAAQTQVNRPDKPVPSRLSTTSTAGPAAMPTPDPASPAEVETTNQIRFHFAPTMGPLLNPSPEDVQEGTDAWAFAKGYVSVTPIRAEYAALDRGGRPFGSDEPSDQWAGRVWK